jgi:hypothetical protein
MLDLFSPYFGTDANRHFLHIQANEVPLSTLGHDHNYAQVLLTWSLIY